MDWKATLRTSNQKRGNQKNGFWLALALVYHLPQIPRSSCWGVNGKRFFGSSCWKFSGQMEIMVVYHLQKDSGKIQLESNLMAGTWLFGEQQTSEQVVLFLRTGYSKQKFVFHFFNAIFDTSFRTSRPFSGKWNWFVQMANAILGRNLPVMNFVSRLCAPASVICFFLKRQ